MALLDAMPFRAEVARLFLTDFCEDRRRQAAARSIATRVAPSRRPSSARKSEKLVPTYFDLVTTFSAGV